MVVGVAFQAGVEVAVSPRAGAGILKVEEDDHGLCDPSAGAAEVATGSRTIRQQPMVARGVAGAVEDLSTLAARARLQRMGHRVPVPPQNRLLHLNLEQ